MRFANLRPAVLAAPLLLASAAVHADAGMWTFENFPVETVSKKYDVELKGDWLDQVRRSITRHESGCTGSFISPDGLVLTNHHCIVSCLAELSSPTEDLLANGFHARERSEERRCPTEIISVLIETENVTDRVNGVTRDLPEAAANEARKRELSRLEAECTAAAKKRRDTGPLACESVTLYQGGEYWLYKYRRFDDVRLVFAPHQDIAAFGGDPDNFNFPRWALDMSLLRVYQDDRPAKTPTHLKWRPEGAAAGEPVFVAGHPGTTYRLWTMAQLDFQRDVFTASYIARNSELRGRLIQWSRTSPEAERIVQDLLQTVENGLKVVRGWQRALNDNALMERKREAERATRTLAAMQSGGDTGATPWETIEGAYQTYRAIYPGYLFLEGGAGFLSDLFNHARQLVRAAEERSKPNEERLREFAESNLPKIKATVLGDTPIYPEFEQMKLAFSLEKLREWLGPDDPVVRRLLGEESPESLAARLVSGTQLADVEVRRSLWEGGLAAIEASTDPMIVLAREIDADARAIRKRYEDEVQAPTAAAHEEIAAMRFRMFGTDTYPDATFTLRMSYGAVQGWSENGVQIAPFTQLDRLYERTTGREPFALPDVWVQKKPELDLSTRFNFVTTNDIVGGNSGSPILDAEGRLVGLAFDGNIHSIAGSFGYDPELNRTVAVHPAIMVEALREVYEADELLREILGAR